MIKIGSYQMHYEIWQNGLILGTIALALTIVYTIHPVSMAPFNVGLLYFATGFAYFFSLFGFKQCNKLKSRKENE